MVIELLIKIFFHGFFHWFFHGSTVRLFGFTVMASVRTFFHAVGRRGERMQQKRLKRTGMRNKGELRQRQAAVDKRAMTNEKRGEKRMDGKGK